MDSDNTTCHIFELSHTKSARIPDDRFDIFTTGQQAAMAYVIILAVVGFFGNVLVLVVFSTQYKKTSTYVIFVLSLALIDFLMCTVHMPLEVLDLRFPYDFFSNTICKLFRSLQAVLSLTSILILLLISVDRYRHVCFPMKDQWSATMAKRLIFACVIIAIIASIPVPFIYGPDKVRFGGNVTRTVCFFEQKSSKTNIFPMIYVVFLNISFVLSLVILIFNYVSIGVAMKTQEKQRLDMTSHKEEIERRHVIHYICFPVKKRDKVDNFSLENDTVRISPASTHKRHIRKSSRFHMSDGRRATIILFAITLIFILAYLPYVTIGLALTLGLELRKGSATEIIFYRIGIRLLLINNVSNCFVYGILDQRFKKACRKLYSKLKSSCFQKH